MISRRDLLVLGAGVAAAGSLSTSSAHAAVHPRLDRSIYLYNTHTGEFLRTVYWHSGHYQPAAMRQINKIMRDHYSGDVRTMDPKIIDLVALMQSKLGPHRPVHIVCGYRSPRTNAMLRRNTDGVAAHSLHMEGKAIDLRIEGLSIEHLGRFARSLRRGGVGQYPDSDFVHVDVGKIRTWDAG